MILGQSGRGKSTSIENLNPDETMVIKAINKPFPFRSKEWKRWDAEKKVGSYEVTDNYDIVKAIVANAHKYNKKVIVIDDAQYLMSNDFMRRINERGFDKFSAIAESYWSLLNIANEKAPDDVRIYFLSHIEQNDNGEQKAKTIGKLLDDKITVEGLFTIVLGAEKDKDEYYFSTQNNGRNTVKSPRGMFEFERIPNDLKLVDDAIVDYYGLN